MIRGPRHGLAHRRAVSRFLCGLICSAATAVLSAPAFTQTPAEPFVYRQVCDASAAVALDESHFAVADDDRNVIQIYRRGVAEPVGHLDVSRLLGTREDQDSDIEGAARVGSRIYWIASHGRNSRGEPQPRRQRFFATDLRAGNPPRLVLAGIASARLLDGMLAAPSLRELKLADAAALAPESAGGLNIEGLAAAPDGSLLIGFRNPRPAGQALIVPLLNPRRVVQGKRARFGAPIRLDLGGDGVRSIERVGDAYLIVAGPPADQGAFALYRWSGRSADAPAPVAVAPFDGLQPEALFAFSGADTVQILSDDGAVMHDGKICKALVGSARQFRSITVRP